MVSAESVFEQLKRIHVNTNSWGRTEILELPAILLPEEEIYECVNGFYDAGFALLVATNVRVLLIDRKPLNYLTVEDLRFDMINELDYSHRLIGAQISISAGAKTLIFRSYNKNRLRKLLNHVQHCMAEIKKQHQEQQEGQNQSLQNINEQLQLYLLMQQGHERELTRRLMEAQDQTGIASATIPQQPSNVSWGRTDERLTEQLAAAATDEIFNHPTPTTHSISSGQATVSSDGKIQLDPTRTAFAHVPLSMRQRNFGHAASSASGVSQ